MPRISPVGAETGWPPSEGAVGVIGVAPWATIAFMSALYGLVAAKKDWHYPRVLADVNTKIPSRGRHLQLGERDPSPYIAATIEELAAQGASVCVVPCNTAHILFDRWAKDASIPVLNIVDVSVFRAVDRGFKRAVILGSNSLIQSDIYQNRLRKSGLLVDPLPVSQAFVDSCISSVKQDGKIQIEQELILRKDLFGADIDPERAIVLACTELSPLLRFAEIDVVVDSNLELARAALRAVSR